MENMDNKGIFAKNLNRYIYLIGKTKKEVCDELGFAYSTFSDWCNGKKFPRLDKLEMLANYFGIQKSDLIEDKTDKSVGTVEPSDYYVKLKNKVKTDEVMNVYLELTDKQQKRVMEYMKMVKEGLL